MPQTCCKSQFYRLLATCQQTATNLSISSSCNKSVKIRLVAACHLQTRYNLLKQLEASLWITSFDNQLATSLLTTCIRLAVNKLSQVIRTHPDIGLLITSLLQLARFFGVYFRRRRHLPNLADKQTKKRSLGLLVFLFQIHKRLLSYDAVVRIYVMKSIKSQ